MSGIHDAEQLKVRAEKAEADASYLADEAYKRLHRAIKAELRVRELEAEVARLLASNERLLRKHDDLRECADAGWEAARLAKSPPLSDPRREVGAVVLWAGFEYVVVSRHGERTQRRVTDPSWPLVEAAKRDAFVRWATPEECAAHGIPYVERGERPAPAGADALRAACERAAREAVMLTLAAKGTVIASGVEEGIIARAVQAGINPPNEGGPK